MKRMLLVLLVLVTATAMAAPYQTTAAVGSSWTTVCALSMEQNSNVYFGLSNTGANALTDCKVEAWIGPDETDSSWTPVDIGWVDCKALAASGTAVWTARGVAYTRLRVQAQSTAGTSAYCRQNATNK